MTQHKFKLIIWDFDGVIADTEHLWVKNRQKMLNEKFNLDWDFATANKYLGGMSDKTKRLNLDKLGIKTDDKFWEDALAADYLPPIWLNTANRNLICFGWRPRQWENNRKTASL